MTGAGSNSRRTPYNVAKQLLTSTSLSFDDAYLLSRVVLEFGGGPVALKGKESPRFDKHAVRRLLRAGWLERGGAEAAPRAHVTSVRNLSRNGQVWTATVALSEGQLSADAISASDEAIALVHSAVADETPAAQRYGAMATPVARTKEFEIFGIRSSRADKNTMEDDEVSTDSSGPVAPTGGGLGDFKAFADDLFDIWAGGSEIGWASYTWDVLSRAGLTAWADEAERALVFCRLVTLAGLNYEFAARAWGEGAPGEWRESINIDDVIGEYPLLNEIALGRLAERLNIRATPSWYGGREGAHDLVVAIASRQWSTVVRALLDELGTAVLFASLWTSAEDGADYPLTPDALHEVVNTDVTSAKVDAYSWIEDGCV